MAKIEIFSETRPLSIIVQTETESGRTFGVCPQCSITITDRGHFEDTVEAISTHLDRQEC